MHEYYTERLAEMACEIGRNQGAFELILQALESIVDPEKLKEEIERLASQQLRRPS